MRELGHSEVEFGDDLPVPTLLRSTAHIRFSRVSAAEGSNTALSAAGKVFTWGCGRGWLLGHGDEETTFLPRQVDALHEHDIMSVAMG